MSKTAYEMVKNSRAAIRFSLAEFKGYKFIDIRVFAKEEGKDPVPTPKGVTVSPTLWPEFKKALAQVEAAMIQEGWLDQEDLEIQG
jgi:hypothetical protein